MYFVPFATGFLMLLKNKQTDNQTTKQQTNKQTKAMYACKLALTLLMSDLMHHSIQGQHNKKQQK